MPEPTSATPNTPQTPELTGFAKDVGGDWDKAAERFHNVTHQNIALQRQLQEVSQQMEAVRQANNQQMRGPAYLDTLATELGVQPNVIAGALAEIAAPMVRQAVAPITETLAARSHLATTLPDYIKNESDIFAWATSQPELMQEVLPALRSTQPGQATLAARLLYREWQAANPPKNAVPADPPPGAQMPALGGGGNPTHAANAAQSDANAKAFGERLKAAVMSRDARHVAGDLFADTQWIAPPGFQAS